MPAMGYQFRCGNTFGTTSLNQDSSGICRSAEFSVAEAEFSIAEAEFLEGR